jgi:hypothetical protein
MLLKKYLTLLISLIAYAVSYGQAGYEPQILILTPNEVKYDKALEQEVTEITGEIRTAVKEGKINSLIEDTTDQPENIRMMVRNERAFSQTLDLSRITSFAALHYLSYFFFERFPNLLILVKDIKSSGKAADLKKIARSQQMQYVLNFSKVNFYKDAGISKATMTVQLYDGETNSFVIDREFTGDWKNPGFTFTCKDSSLLCTINNALSEAIYQVTELVMIRSGVFEREHESAEQQEELSDKRFKVLADKYYPKPYDSSFVNSVISPADTHINSKALYRALVDDTKTKFIAFYMETEHRPMYLYQVKGAKVGDKWYYTKSEVSQFPQGDPEVARRGYFTSLQEWDFFKAGSLEYNPKFWEMGLFETIKDVKKAPNWEKYKEMLEVEEHENRDYVGMPEFVANELKRQRKEANDRFDSVTGSTVFLPFYERQMKTKPGQFAQYTLWGKKPILIFPKHRKYALSPVAVTDSSGHKNLRFYFAMAGSDTVYEWTYFEPVPIKTYSGDIIDQLQKLTRWNFSYSNLNDDAFWETYVLARSGNKYKYLERVQ